MSAHLISMYMDLRGRGEGDVSQTLEIVPNRLMLDVDEDGLALGIEKIGSEPLTLPDLYACMMAGRFGSPAPERGDLPQ